MKELFFLKMDSFVIIAYIYKSIIFLNNENELTKNNLVNFCSKYI